MQNIFSCTIPGSTEQPMALDFHYDDAIEQAATIIYAHGFNGFKDWGNFDLIANQFVEAGFSVVKFNFSHNGTTPESPQDFVALDLFAENNYTRQLYDLEQIINWVRNAPSAISSFIDKEKIGLIGHSMGGGISILFASENEAVKALVTWAAIVECKTPWTNWDEEKLKEWKEIGVAYYHNGRTGQDLPMHYQLYRDFIANEERLDIIRAEKKLKIPHLVCHGIEDTSVPLTAAEQIAEAGVATRLFTIASDHVFGRKHPWPEHILPYPMQKVVRENIEFFKQVLLSA